MGKGIETGIGAWKYPGMKSGNPAGCARFSSFSLGGSSGEVCMGLTSGPSERSREGNEFVLLAASAGGGGVGFSSTRGGSIS